MFSLPMMQLTLLKANRATAQFRLVVAVYSLRAILIFNEHAIHLEVHLYLQDKMILSAF